MEWGKGNLNLSLVYLGGKIVVKWIFHDSILLLSHLKQFFYRLSQFIYVTKENFPQKN